MRHALFIVGALALAAAISSGCTPRQQALRASANALKQKDYDQTILLANEAMDEKPSPQEAAEALYLRGRAYEERPVSSQGQLDTNMQAARNSYVDALRRGPSKELSTYIRASLGKVAFFQDDFGTASQQLWLAYGDLKDPELKAASLYYMGKAQQRSGQFNDADQTLSNVAQRYPNTEWAKKAAASRGIRAFYVQLGAYANPKSAETMIKAMQQRGIRPAQATDAQGRYLLRAGPFGSYAQAKQARQRLQDLVKDAFVVP
jgi:outer membrane protein assembly factor BamD (BamD/ComL family)